jgi:hypothetical protein
MGGGFMLLKFYGILLVLLLICHSASAAGASQSDAAEYGALSIAQNSGSIAYIDNTTKNLVVKISDGKNYHLAIPNFAEKISLSWSPDGRYILMEYQSNNDSSFVYAINVESTNSLNPQFLADGFSARWFGPDHSVLIIPNYGAAEIQSKKGIICMVAGSSKRKYLFKKYYFTGNYAISRKSLVAQVFTKIRGGEKYILFTGDLDLKGQCG